jgi:DNA-binding IclR family transcriptional regulator
MQITFHNVKHERRQNLPHTSHRPHGRPARCTRRAGWQHVAEDPLGRNRLHPSTAFRILASLIQHGFVARDETGLYLLGPHLLQLAAKVRVGLDVRAVARPEMEWLRDQVGETVNLTVRQGDEMVYVERVTPNRMMRVEQLIGSRAPLHVTAVGKLMLGEAGAAATRDYAKRTRLPAYTANTRHDIKACWKTSASAARAATPWTTRKRNWASAASAR